MRLTSCVSLVVVVLLAASPASAQIIITSEAWPEAVGTIWQMYRNLSPGVAVDVGSAGPFQIWDFSDGPEEVVSTTTIVSVEETPFATEVLGRADGAWVRRETIGAETIETEYTYFRRTSSEVLLIAVATEGSWFTIFDPGLVVLHFPLEFDHSWSSRSIYNRSRLSGYVVSIMRSWIVYDVVADAWGSVKVPAGDYECIRLRRSVRFNIPGGGEQKGILYQWIAQGIGTVASVLSLPGEEDLNFTRAFSVSRLKSTSLTAEIAPVSWGRIKHMHR